MSDSDQSATEVENNEPAPELEEAEEHGNTEAEGNDGDGDDEELEDAEYEGKSYKVPKPLKDALLRHADYTRKTQDLADKGRAHEAKEAEFQENQRQFQEHQQRSQATFEGRAVVAALDMQLRQFQGVNWNQLAQENPTEASRLNIQFQQLRAQREDVARQVSQKEHEGLQQEQAKLARQQEQAQEVLRREIKDWSPQTRDKVRDYVIGAGVPASELRNITHPSIVKLLHRAMTADQARTQVQRKPTAPPAAPIKVIKSGNGNSSVDPSRLSADEWAKRRNQELAKRNRP